jgi:very-short-patch-repair endonuclease
VPKRRQRAASKNLERARDLRREMTAPEKKLWGVLRDRRLAGLKFRRQVPVGRYIADFACVESMLVVEVDGDSHAERFVPDQKREQALIEAGWRVLRLSNDDVLENLEGVLIQIVKHSGLDPAKWRDGEYGQLPEGTI